MAYNETERMLARERISESSLPHGGQRILRLERGLYVLRERHVWGEGGSHVAQRREREEREFQPVSGF